jgi:two-component system, NtrC family, response regulator AtoC
VTDCGVAARLWYSAYVTTEILLVEDDPDQGEMLGALLRRRGLSATVLQSAEEVLIKLAEREPIAVVADIHLGRGMSGIELCARVREQAPEVPVIVMTGAGSLEVAIEAIRAGAYDFVTKPIAPDALMASVQRAVERRSLRAEVKRLRGEVDAQRPIHGILGDSPALREIVALIRRVADSDATVLVNGESGTGKELISRAVHDLGPRKDHPFVAINCAAVPAGLLESELFGHVKGAFTDAKRDRQGLFAQAAGGTIFLDEIGEMPMEMQAKLLRVLQERKVRPVGGDEELAVDARVVCATNRDLEAEVEAGRFREDLFYRVNVVALRVPPLRERSSDVLTLATHFAARIAERTGKPARRISPEAARRMVDYDWPGNVRELENCIERAVALCGGEEIVLLDLPEKVQAHHPTRMIVGGDDGSELITLAEMEQRYVRKVLAAVSGNKSHAARLLGIDRRSLYRRLETASEAANVAASVAGIAASHEHEPK